MPHKTKRKHNHRSLFKLKLILIVFIIGTWLATFFPMVWLAPPLFPLTPFVYIGLSLLWIPIVWRLLRFITWDRITIILIVCCLISSLMMVRIFDVNITTDIGCYESDPNDIEPMRCYVVGEPCHPSFEVVQVDNMLLAQESPWYWGCALYFPPF